jgi:hypothetical protein
MFRRLAGYLYRAVMQPAPRHRQVQPIRALVGVPVVFDLVSFALQLRDLGRVGRIGEGSASQDPHHKAAHDYNIGVTKSKSLRLRAVPKSITNSQPFQHEIYPLNDSLSLAPATFKKFLLLGFMVFV